LSTETVPYLPQFIFQQPNFRHYFPQGEPGGSGGISAKILAAIMPAALDTTYENLRFFQLMRNHLVTPSSNIRPFYNIKLGANRLLSLAGDDIKIGNIAASPSTIPQHLLKIDKSQGWIRGFVNPSSFKDLDAFQINYGKTVAPGTSTPETVWDTAHFNNVFTFESDTPTTFDDKTSNNNNGSSASPGKIVTGLYGLNAYSTNANTNAQINIPNSASSDLSGIFTQLILLEISSSHVGNFSVMSKKFAIDGNEPGIMINYNSANEAALELRINNGSMSTDEVIKLPNSRDHLRLNQFHVIALSINNTTRAFQLSIDGDPTLTISGTYTTTGSILTSNITELGKNIGAGIFDAIYQTYINAKAFWTLDEIKTFTDNMLDYPNTIHQTNIDLPALAAPNFALGVVTQNWPKRDWLDRIDLEVAPGMMGQSENNFVILVEKTIPSLIGKVKPNGEDIRFTDIDGTDLDYDIEAFDNLTGKVVIWVFHKSAFVGMRFFLYHNNPSAVDAQSSHLVWNAYDATFHLSQPFVLNSPSMLDSTRNENNGTPTGTGISQVAAKIDKGIANDGGDNLSRITATLPIDESFYVSVWAKCNTTTYAKNTALISSRGNNGMGLFPSPTVGAGKGIRVFIMNNSAVVTEITAIIPSDITVWHKYGLAWNASTGIAISLLDGEIVGSLPKTIVRDAHSNITSTMAYDISPGDPNREYDGEIDEIEICRVFPTVEFLRSEYKTQNDPAGFLILGTPESLLTANTAIDVTPHLINPAWKKRMNLTTQSGQFQGVGKLTGYQIYVEIQDDLLKTETNLDGSDLLFTDKKGDLIPFEIKEFNRTAGTIKVYFKQTISSLDNTINHLFFSNPVAVDAQNKNGVWSDYDAAYLFAEPSPLAIGGTLLDSTASPLNGIVQDDPLVDRAGQTGNAKNMGTATAADVAFLSSTKLAGSTFTSFEIMAERIVSSGGIFPMLFNLGATVNTNVSIFLATGTVPSVNYTLSDLTSHSVASPTAINDGNFHLIHVIFDNTGMYLYVDKILKASKAHINKSLKTTATPAQIGSSGIAGLPWGPNESINFVKKTNRALSKIYRDTSYQNYFNPSTFTLKSAVIDNE